eukprot:m.242275 g.242275  ORF g.242275 m.242275 type:complete len:747 (-) comp54439_c0_seq1:151-2391(-)
MAEAATVRKLLKQLSNSGTAIEAAAQLDDFITSDGKLPVLVANAKIAISVGLFTGLKEVFKQKHVELPLLESLANLVWNLGIDKGIRQMALTDGLYGVIISALKDCKAEDEGQIKFYCKALINAFLDADIVAKYERENVAEALEAKLASIQDTTALIGLFDLMCILGGHAEMEAYFSKSNFLTSFPSIISSFRDQLQEHRVWESIAQITVVSAHSKRLMEGGILKEVHRVLTSKRLELRFAAVFVARNLTFDAKASITEFYAHQTLPVLISLLDHCKDTANAEANHAALLTTLSNSAVDEHCAQELMKCLPRLVAEFNRAMESPGEEFHTLRLCTALLYNLTTRESLLHELRQANLVDLINPLMKHEQEFFRVLASMSISNLIGHLENHPLLETDLQIIQSLAVLLRHALEKSLFVDVRWFPYGPLQSLANLSVNDKNKSFILQTDIPQLLLSALNDSESEERVTFSAAKIACNLSFATDVNTKVPGLDAKLTELSISSPSKRVREQAGIAVFQLSQRRKKRDDAPVAVKGLHIMLSYPWKYQPLFLWLKKLLEERGYQVWMDVDQMSSSVLAAMASAVENSSLVIYCLSTAYKESEACRTEGEYAYNLRKPMIPVKTEAKYRPDGWLGALTGNKLYFDFANPTAHQEKAEQLLKEIERHGIPRGSVGGSPPSEGASRSGEAALSARLAESESKIKELLRENYQLSQGSKDSQLRERIDQLERDLIARITRLENRPVQTSSCCSIQ